MLGSPIENIKEIQAVLATFFAADAPVKLGSFFVSVELLTALLIALQHTSHPSVFNAIAEPIELYFAPLAYDFSQRVALYEKKSRKIIARYLGCFIIGFSILAGFSVAVTRGGTIPCAILAPIYFLGILFALYAMNHPCLALHGFRSRQLRPWEVFMPTSENYMSKRRQPGFLFGIARKESLNGTPWIIQCNTRMILWKNFSLFLGNKFEQMFGKLCVKILGQPFVTDFYESFHKKLEKEIWIEKPGIYQFHNEIFYSAATLSFIATGIVTFFWLVIQHWLH